MLSRGGKADGIGSQCLSATKKERGSNRGAPHTPLQYTHPHQSPSGSPSSKMAPPVWSPFYDRSSSYSSLTSPPPSAQGKHVGLVGGICAPDVSIELCIPSCSAAASQARQRAPLGPPRRGGRGTALWELQCPEGKTDACAVTAVSPREVPRGFCTSLESAGAQAESVAPDR